MEYRKLIDFLNVIEKLKCYTRHSYTTTGRKESVAEHTFRLCVMALLCRDEYKELDMDKVIRMCIIHDFGEAVTGDIPSFYKTRDDEKAEEEAVAKLLNTLPDYYEAEFTALFAEMKERKTPEAKLVKALDNMEAVVSHNEADISTWLPKEYTENLIYGEENCKWSEWTKGLREMLKEDSATKIKREGKLNT